MPADANTYEPAIYRPPTPEKPEGETVSSADGTLWHEFAARPENAAAVRSGKAFPQFRKAFDAANERKGGK